MIRIIPNESPSYGGMGFDLVESDGTITKLIPHRRGDMTIEQLHPGEKPVVLSTYSNPGTTPYAIFLKFLYMNKVPFPKTLPDKQIRKKFGGRELPHDSSAEYAGMIAVLQPFPIPFPARLDETVRAHFVQEGKSSFLEFEIGNEKMKMSLELVQKLATYLPKVYEGQPMSFRFIQRTILETLRLRKFEPVKKSHIEIREPKLPARRATQAGFDFPEGKAFRKKPNTSLRGRRRRSSR